MKIKLKNIGTFLLILFIGTVSFTSCENKDWEEHYRIDDQIKSNKNLWELISTNPELKKFTWALKKTKYKGILYKDLLASGQMFTVWAPVDTAQNNIDTTDASINKLILAKEYIDNHISNFGYSASGTDSVKIDLLNGKVMNFKNMGADYTLGGTKLIKRNMISSNGLLHIVSKRLNFFDNVWEVLSKDSRLDSVKNFLYSFDQILIDEYRSTVGGVNDNGDIEYLDTVLINTNQMFKVLGKLTVEDSSYTAIWPTNSAWDKSYARIKEFYRYSTKVEPITADTLQRNNTTLALVQDLTFSNNHKVQLSPKDSLTSNNKNVFLQPDYLFEGAEKVNVSNGTVYITEDLKYRHTESWNKEIRVEAEQTKGREIKAATGFVRTFKDLKYGEISDQKYLEMIAENTFFSPNVTFEIPNTLSGKLADETTVEFGTSYNIYCVMVPQEISKSKENAKPNKLEFEIAYLNESSNKKTLKYKNDGEYFISKQDTVSKILVVSNFTFPFCDVGLEETNVTLKVKSKVKQNETAKYSRDMLIDCIILEPVQ